MRCTMPRPCSRASGATTARSSNRPSIPNVCGCRANFSTCRCPSRVAEINAAKEATLKANNLTDAYVRAIAWRGAGEMMGVASSKQPDPPGRRLLDLGQLLRRRQVQGRQAGHRQVETPRPETIPFAAKAAGLYMICTMSKHAAEAKGCSDAMMFDYRGYVAEATGANIFFVKDGEVHTPLADCILNGITRQTVIGMLNDMQIKVHERHIMPEELEGFEQCWLTGTAAEITPVGQIGDYNFEVGDLVKRVSSEYEKLVRA